MAKGDKSDSRFSSIQTDPRFQLPRKKLIRGDVDSRFKDALESDERFTKKAHIDKYGRRIKEKSTRKELSRYYNLEDDENDSKTSATSSDSDTAEESESDIAREDHRDELDSQAVATKPPTKHNYHMRDLMRGDVIVESSSSDDSSSDDDDLKTSSSNSSSDSSDSESEAIPNIEDEYEQVRPAAESIPQGSETHRIAVVNLDWDNVNSTDLMATFSSFVPRNRHIVSVKIYQSEFGKTQMALEEVNGPAQELFPESSKSTKNAEKRKKKSEVFDIDEEQDYSSSRLRKYQLQRLKYYYAVVECDSVETALKIYSSCDGTEYESTANFFDLRFIPDDVSFTDDKPRDECFKLPQNYRPTTFTTDALQHSKVKLTWDETPKERSRVAQKAFGKHDVEDEDLKAYLASASESDENEMSIADRYRSLISGDSKTAVDENSESDAVDITFNPVLEGKTAKLEVINDSSANSVDPASNLSTIEQYRLKEKQRRLRRQENYKARKAAEAEQMAKNSSADRAELELLAMDDEYNGTVENSKLQTNGKDNKKVTKRAAKKKALEEAEQDFDTADPRFQALYEDPDFAIDSTLPQFKKTKGMEKIINERRKRQDANIENEDTRFGKFKRKKLNSAPQETEESIKHLVSKLSQKSGR